MRPIYIFKIGVKFYGKKYEERHMRQYLNLNIPEITVNSKNDNVS